MSNSKASLAKGKVILTLATAIGFGIGGPASGQNVPHLATTHPGGFPGMPVMTGIERTTNGVRLTWDGPAGYYQLYQRLGATGPAWEKVGGPNLSRTADLAVLHSNVFFKVAGPSPRYAGSERCLECHENVHAGMESRHAQAFESLKRVNRQNNPRCLACHTVGYGLPTGFISESATRHLAGVQCESCHGPAANHAANELDFTARPRVELAGQLCGGCHNDFHHPTFDEWKSSGHFAVVEDMNSAGRINSCGRCHSGSARMALMKGENPALTVTGDANVGITCAVCHDPNAAQVWTNVLSGAVSTNQLRYPVASTNDFVLTTGEAFNNRYDVNVCAQCHNHRGATWTSSARPPHHSPQYNMLLGTVGELEAGLLPWRAGHATRIEKQCVGCHMPSDGDGSEGHPDFAGHTFKVESFASCRDCHPLPELLTVFATTAVTAQIQQLKGFLDHWATTKSPPALQAKYGARAWEYTNPGDLSSGGPGPSSSEQAQIPDNIKKARFNLYLVTYDGSFGVHNGPHAAALLESARNWVQVELKK